MTSSSSGPEKKDRHHSKPRAGKKRSAATGKSRTSEVGKSRTAPGGDRRNSAGKKPDQKTPGDAAAVRKGKEKKARSPAPASAKAGHRKSSFSATQQGPASAPQGSDKSELALKAITMRGLEEVLAQEIRRLGGKNVRPGRGVVLFRGDFSLLYRSCYNLRTAMRVLLELGSTRIGDQVDLYKFARRLPWRDWFGVQNTMAVEAAVHSRIFSNSHFAALRLKDAICDEFKARTGKRPDVSVRDADIRVHLHLHEQDCSISLDAAGGSLHRRGYRVTAEAAPLSEVLAAGMILIADPDWKAPFYDFMCGSGTIPLEAFMVRNNLPPGIFREMSFENWKIYFAKEHKKVLDQAKGAWKGARAAASASLEVADKEPGAGDNSLRDQALDISEGRKAMIRGSDVSDRSIQVAKNNRKWLKLTADQVFFETLEAAHIQELPASGTAIINPPYGERLSLEDAAAFYKELGDIMKKSFKGWSVWILSSNKEGLKSIGLKAAQKHTLFNGPLECSFRRYDMY